MKANILPTAPPFSSPSPGGGVIWSKFNLFKTWFCCISNYMQSRMQQHVSKYFARELLSPHLTQGTGTKGQNLTFSEHSHVAYQPPPLALG